MTRLGFFVLSLVLALVVNFAMTAYLSGGQGGVLAYALSAILLMLYSHFGPLCLANLGKTPIQIASIFTVTALVWAIFRGFQTSFVNYRANGFQLIEAGTPTVWFFVFEVMTIGAIALLMIAFGVKYGRR